MPNLNWHIFVFNFFKMLAQNQVKQSHKWSLSMELINLSLPVIAKCLFEWPCPVISCCDNHTNSIKAVVMVCIVLNICKLYCTPQQPEVIVLKKKKNCAKRVFFFISFFFSFSSSSSSSFPSLICNDYVIRAARQKGGATIISALD